jgi:sporulation protein YlmC with PRC-barrel domain
MLQVSNIYYDRPILSLRTGGPIGHALNPVINPNNLKIEGWYATAKGERTSYIVPISEVRDIINKGIVVNDHSSLTNVDDLVRLKSVIDLGFEIIGKQVVTENKHKLGKVADFAVDDQSMLIKKLYVNQSLIKNLSIQQLVVDRNQIVELDNRRVVVRDASIKSGASAAQATQPA